MTSLGTVLVAGGAGYIGSYVVDELAKLDLKIIVADDLSTGRIKNIDQQSHIVFRKLDLRSRDDARKAVTGADTVINLASKVGGVGYSTTHHSEMLTSTLQISLNLLEAAVDAGVGRFYFMSSSCVYPESSPIPTPESMWDEDTPETANEGYGWAKRIGELQANYYAREHGIKVTIGRPSNVFGGTRYNWHGSQAGHVIPSLLKRALVEDPLSVWGSGNQTRNFIHVRDVAKIVVGLTEADAGRAVNIGGEEETSIRDLANTVIKVIGKDLKIKFDTTKPEGTKRRALDTTHLKHFLPDFKPSVSLEEGIREMYTGLLSK